MVKTSKPLVITAAAVGASILLTTTVVLGTGNALYNIGIKRPDEKPATAGHRRSNSNSDDDVFDLVK